MAFGPHPESGPQVWRIHCPQGRPGLSLSSGAVSGSGDARADLESAREYRRFLEVLDRLCAVLAERYRPLLRCRRGCAECCTGVPLWPVEADYLHAGISASGDPDLMDAWSRLNEGDDPVDHTGLPDEGPSVPGGEAELHCVFLDRQEGACRVYPWRPVICRGHGLPLRYGLAEYDAAGMRIDRPETRESLVTWCDNNFPESDPEDPWPDALDMDLLNAMLERFDAVTGGR